MRPTCIEYLTVSRSGPLTATCFKSAVMTQMVQHAHDSMTTSERKSTQGSAQRHRVACSHAPQCRVLYLDAGKTVDQYRPYVVLGQLGQHASPASVGRRLPLTRSAAATHKWSAPSPRPTARSGPCRTRTTCAGLIWAVLGAGRSGCAGRPVRKASCSVSQRNNLERRLRAGSAWSAEGAPGCPVDNLQHNLHAAHAGSRVVVKVAKRAPGACRGVDRR